MVDEAQEERRKLLNKIREASEVVSDMDEFLDELLQIEIASDNYESAKLIADLKSGYQGTATAGDLASAIDALAPKETRMTKIFISYSRQNNYISRRLKLDLQRAGLDPWFDQSDIKINEEWLKKIAESIKQCDYLVYVWSPESRDSEYVQHEVEIAKKHLGIDKVLPFRVAGRSGDMEGEIRKRHAAVTKSPDDNIGYWTALESFH